MDESVSKKFIDSLIEMKAAKNTHQMENLLEEHITEITVIIHDKRQHLQEGIWKQEKGGYYSRIDPEIPDMKQQRHVHVAKSKEIVNKESSWNADGTRHDKHKFPQKVTNAAKEIAREKLGLGPDVVLEVIQIYFDDEIDDQFLFLLNE